MSELSIRAAVPEDAETIVAFIHDLAVYEKEPDAVENTAENLRAQLSSEAPPFECLIAERGGEPVAFALYFFTYSTWTGKRGLWLEDLWVAEEARRRGVAKALFVRLAQIAKERECARFEWHVLRWNELALGFYESLGAESLDEWVSQRLDAAAIDELA